MTPLRGAAVGQQCSAAATAARPPRSGLPHLCGNQMVCPHGQPHMPDSRCTYVSALACTTARCPPTPQSSLCDAPFCTWPPCLLFAPAALTCWACRIVVNAIPTRSYLFSILVLLSRSLPILLPRRCTRIPTADRDRGAPTTRRHASLLRKAPPPPHAPELASALHC